MRLAPTSYRQLALGGLELFALLGASGLISLYFPHWIPKATVDPTQREWASVFSAGALLACAVSLRALNLLTKAVPTASMQWQALRGTLLKWGSMGIDAAAFLWSTRACTDRDSMIVTVLMGLAYFGLPLILRRNARGQASGQQDGYAFARIVRAAAFIALIFLLLSGGITEI